MTSQNAEHRHLPRNPIIKVFRKDNKVKCPNYGIYPDCKGEVEELYGNVCDSCYNVMSGH